VIKGVHHTSIQVAGLEKATRFYESLGLEVFNRFDKNNYFELLQQKNEILGFEN
jgi:catechol 2,3-dioxygenase-like lactoylglutathione lyase family enzyme